MARVGMALMWVRRSRRSARHRRGSKVSWIADAPRVPICTAMRAMLLTRANDSPAARCVRVPPAGGGGPRLASASRLRCATRLFGAPVAAGEDDATAASGETDVRRRTRAGGDALDACDGPTHDLVRVQPDTRGGWSIASTMPEVGIVPARL